MRLSKTFSLLVGILFALGVAVFLSFSDAPPKRSPVDFVRSVYGGLYYPGSNSSSLDKADEIYSSTLLSLINKEQKQHIVSGELGKLSADPLCNCQDPESVDVLEIAPKEAQPDAVAVMVTLSVSGVTENLTLNLVKEAGFWKIDDVLATQTASLRRYLIEN